MANSSKSRKEPILSDERQKADMEAKEAACNEKPQRRDLSKECRILPVKSAYDATAVSNIFAGN